MLDKRALAPVADKVATKVVADGLGIGRTELVQKEEGGGDVVLSVHIRCSPSTLRPAVSVVVVGGEKLMDAGRVLYELAVEVGWAELSLHVLERRARVAKDDTLTAECSRVGLDETLDQLTLLLAVETLGGVEVDDLVWLDVVLGHAALKVGHLLRPR